MCRATWQLGLASFILRVQPAFRQSVSMSVLASAVRLLSSCVSQWMRLFQGWAAILVVGSDVLSA